MSREFVYFPILSIGDCMKMIPKANLRNSTFHLLRGSVRQGFENSLTTSGPTVSRGCIRLGRVTTVAKGLPGYWILFQSGSLVCPVTEF